MAKWLAMGVLRNWLLVTLVTTEKAKFGMDKKIKKQFLC
jgi:hypothetical protein